jgi:hypothetical protein
VPAPFYSLTHARGMVEEADWLSGDHRIEGVVVAVGPEVMPGPLRERVELIDLGPSSLAALGASSEVPRDGKVIASLVGSNVTLNVAGGVVTKSSAADDTGLTSDEAGEIEDHLRGLGYVE